MSAKTASSGMPIPNPPSTDPIPKITTNVTIPRTGCGSRQITGASSHNSRSVGARRCTRASFVRSILSRGAGTCFHDHHDTWRDRDESGVSCLLRAVVEGRYDEFAWTPSGGLPTVAT